MVEIEGERVLAACCIRTPAPGMKVKSQSDRAKTARKMVFELLISDQPDRNTEAHDPASKFWAWADRMEIATSRLPARERDPAPDRSHIAMAVNLDACIQCNLCVRACREVQVNDVIGMAGRGHNEKIVFDFDDPMGAVDLRRLRRVRAGLPDRRADAGDAGERRAMSARRSISPTARSTASARIAASAASSPTTSRTTSCSTSPARTARRTRTGSA